MNATDLRNTLADVGIRPEAMLILDAGLCLPTANWVHGPFDDALDKVLADLGLASWEEERWDCDKFARLAWAYAGICWAKTAAAPNTGLAFGLVCYVSRNSGGGHCINVFVHRDDNGKAHVQFVEPQRQLGGRLLEVQLSPEEIGSIWSIIF